MKKDSNHLIFLWRKGNLSEHIKPCRCHKMKQKQPNRDKIRTFSAPMKSFVKGVVDECSLIFYYRAQTTYKFQLQQNCHDHVPIIHICRTESKETMYCYTTTMQETGTIHPLFLLAYGLTAMPTLILLFYTVLSKLSKNNVMLQENKSSQPRRIAHRTQAFPPTVCTTKASTLLNPCVRPPLRPRENSVKNNLINTEHLKFVEESS